MNTEDYRTEAQRWYRQGVADLDAARGSLILKKYEWASFQAQQAGEKFLKAFWFFQGYDPWGHSLVKLIKDYPDENTRKSIEPLTETAKFLDKMYVPTRYPNGLPELIPAEVYTLDEAQRAVDHAQQILDAIKPFLEP